MIVFVVGLLLAAFAGQALAAVDAVEQETWTAWPNTVYYFAILSGPDAPYNEFTVYISAVDKYSLWINGNRIDTAGTNDNNPATIDSMTVSAVGTQELRVAVQVENLGIGNGNGLLLDIKAGSDWLGTTTMKRRAVYDKLNNAMKTFPAIWYYYAGDVETALGKSDWYKFDQTAFKGFPQKGFQDVIYGEIKGLNYTPDSHIRTIAGYYGGIESGATAGGGIALRRIDGENLALKMPISEEKITDGNLEQGFPYHSDPVAKDSSDPMQVGLDDYYRVNMVRLYTGGSNPQDWLLESVRSYSAALSLTDAANSYTQVAIMDEAGISNEDNGGYDYAEVTFPAQYARFVQYQITESRAGFPHVGEMMVFGTGYKYSGEYVSPWIDFGSPTERKNFGTVTWDGLLPSGTRIEVQTQTVTAEGVESSWGVKHTEKSFDFDSPEPAVKFRYKVTLYTDGVDITPVFKSLAVAYSKTAQPLTGGNISISPNSVPMGSDATFEFNLNYSLEVGQNIKTVVIQVPSMSVADSVFISETGTMLRAGTDFTYSSTTDSLYVTFGAPVENQGGSGMDNMKLYFRTRLLRNVFDFTGGVFNSTMNDGAGPVRLEKNPSGSIRVLTSSVMDEVLSDVKVIPKGFTPNNDGKNDFTVIEFRLANVLNARTRINIFNSNGTLITTLLDEALNAGDYRILDNAKAGNAGQARNLPGYWDGRDEDGDLVPPGIYVYQVVADTEDGEKVKSGTLTVAY